MSDFFVISDDLASWLDSRRTHRTVYRPTADVERRRVLGPAQPYEDPGVLDDGAAGGE